MVLEPTDDFPQVVAVQRLLPSSLFAVPIGRNSDRPTPGDMTFGFRKSWKPGMAEGSRPRSEMHAARAYVRPALSMSMLPGQARGRTVPAPHVRRIFALRLLRGLPRG